MAQHARNCKPPACLSAQDAAIKALTAALAPKAKALRDGKLVTIEAISLVPGGARASCWTSGLLQADGIRHTSPGLGFWFDSTTVIPCSASGSVAGVRHLEHGLPGSPLFVQFYAACGT